jgi:hypothetical protein
MIWRDLKKVWDSLSDGLFPSVSWLQQGLTRTTWLISPRCICSVSNLGRRSIRRVWLQRSQQISSFSAWSSRAHAALKKTQPMKPQSWKANVTQVIVSGHWICPQASFALQYRLLRTKILEGQKDCGKPLHCIPSLGSLESENVLTHRFVQGFLCQWR